MEHTTVWVGVEPASLGGARGWRVSFDARDWTLASEAILRARQEKPEGFRLLSGRIHRRRRRKAGGRCQVLLVWEAVSPVGRATSAEQMRAGMMPMAMAAQGE